MTAASSSADSIITSAAIYPSIGIARVGSSDEYFIGPEVPEPLPPEPGRRRDAEGRLKRQAARFRVYGLNAKGTIVRELGRDDADIAWTVHLVNQKAAWYEFQLALDIPDASSAAPSCLRNPRAPRADLIIDPGPRHLSATRSPPPPFAGSSTGVPVSRGELRAAGARLLVLGGRGKSGSANHKRATTFANNDGWYDDTSDGPVTAEVTYQGKKLDVLPAWVVVAPPNYAPGQKSVRTMWDLMRQVAIDAGMIAAPTGVSFNDDIRPILERLSKLQWVNAGFAATFGFDGTLPFGEPAWLDRLARRSGAASRRRTIANAFRAFARDSWSPTPWPWIYGDAMNLPPARSPREHTEITDTQRAALVAWATGAFADDYPPQRSPPRGIDDVPIAQQGETLTRAALEFCLADAFHPGCEMTWTVRSKALYLAAFRFKHAAMPEPSYGPVMTPEIALGPGGPLGPQPPGGITRWMAVPWQTDAASCRSGYVPEYDPHLPTFWPARVPNQVLSRKHYDIVMDATRPLADRRAAFAKRSAWTRRFDGRNYEESINNLARDIDLPGVVELLPGPTDPGFPRPFTSRSRGAPA